MGKSACLAFLRLELGPDMNERGAEFIVEVDRVFLGHVGGEDKGENPVVDASFDGMNPTISPAMTKWSLFPMLRTVSFWRVMALLRSKENQRANMRSFGSSVMMFAMVPS